MIIQDFIKVLEGEGANTYYSNSLHKVIDIKIVKEIQQELEELL